MKFYPKRLFIAAPSLRSGAFIGLVTLAAAGCAGAGNPAAPALDRGGSSAVGISNMAIHGQSRPRPAATVFVDVRGYMAAAIDKGSNPTMLCKSSPDENICLTSKREGSSTGEVAIFYDKSSGIVDHIAITSYTHGTHGGADAPQFIGVIRNYSGNGGKLRCFSLYVNSSQLCSAPSDSFFVPEGVPYTMSDVPKVSWATVQGAANSDGWSPKEPIPGAKITTTGGTNNYDNFGVENMTRSCVQSPAYGGPSYSKVLVAYVPNVPFGGPSGHAVGTTDALVIDTFATGPPAHAERYFYVQGLGRVAEGSATYDYNTQLYDISPQHVVHHNIRSLDTSDILIDDNNPEPQCPQGSAVPLWGY